MKRLLLVLLITAIVFAATKAPAPEILGVRLGMPYAEACAKLNKIAQFKNEDEGQEVWMLRDDPHYQFLIVGFDRERRVRYVTALARSDGAPVNYGDVGDVQTALRSGQSGNLTYTWRINSRKNSFEYAAIAKGKDSQRLSSYSVKRLGVGGEESEEEEKEKH